MKTIMPADEACERCGQPLDHRMHVGGICGSCADDLRDDMPDDIEAYQNEKAEAMP
ncbi:MAG: hypothetical protein Q8P22_14330 [Chloroflexota bacterium]|nr:hypothetical protein [Chloroflexota bacterium]